MIHILPLLLLAVSSGTYLTDHQHILISGGPAHGKFVSQLQTLLGPDHTIDDFRPLDSQKLLTYTYDTLLLDLSPEDGNWVNWESGIDHFVTRGRALLEEVQGHWSNGKTVSILILPPTSHTEIYRQKFVPLVKQIAREGGAQLYNLCDSTSPASDLFVSLADIIRNPGTWRLISATSEQSDEGPASYAIDNKPESYWHTRYDPNPTKVPHEIVIDLGRGEKIAGFSYLPRQDGGVNGRVGDFGLYLSDDSDKWSQPVIKGTFKNSSSEQRLLLDKPAKGRYLRFVALTEVNGNIWTSIAELGIIRSGTDK